MTRSAKQLTREQQTAVSVFINNRNNMQTILHSSKYFGKQHAIPEANFVAASNHPHQISKMPREKNWCWNQSNAKLTIKIDECTFVTLRKISPRSRNSGKFGSVPSYKIWLYQVESTICQEYYFMWCEKGAVESVDDFLRYDKGVVTEIGTVFPGRISTESLSFLMPFVDESLASELGWI